MRAGHDTDAVGSRILPAAELIEIGLADRVQWVGAAWSIGSANVRAFDMETIHRVAIRHRVPGEGQVAQSTFHLIGWARIDDGRVEAGYARGKSASSECAIAACEVAGLL